MALFNIFIFLLLNYGTHGQSLSGSCSSPSPLCCEGINSLCKRENCYCDVACVRLQDCCNDYNNCVTNKMFTVTESPMISNPIINLTALSRFSGNCSAEPALCCEGTNMSCSRGGCFCDQSCESYGDCCSDYINTCQGLHSVVSRVRVRFRASPATPQQELESTFYRVSENLQLFLKRQYSDILSFRIRRVISL